MLGEDHSLLHEFPEHRETLVRLATSDAEFASEANRYNSLDEQIRNLELDGSPIDDEAMHQLKNDRAALKDKLYSILQEVAKD